MKNQEQLGDQNIINEYFEVIKTLPQSYNLMRQIRNETNSIESTIWKEKMKAYQIAIYDQTEDKKILHYINYLKPFNIDYPYQEKYTYLYTYYMCIIDEKMKKYRKHNKKELN